MLKNRGIGSSSNHIMLYMFFIGSANLQSLYYIHFEITDDPCNQIGSQQCDLFTVLFSAGSYKATAPAS